MVTNRQKRDNIRKWIKALRSGEYSQTTGVLRRKFTDAFGTQIGVGYCCLGVLCDIFKPKDAMWTPDSQGYYAILGDVYAPGSDFTQITGINFRDFEKWYGVGLPHLNDHENASFDEIADMLDLWLLNTK